ncbi:MAG: hypothetical protein ACE5JB_14155 [bacterium]
MFLKSLKFIIILTTMLICSSVLYSQTEFRSKGVGLRWGFWNMGNRSNLVIYIEHNDREFIETGGIGGWLYFVSRVSDNWVFELSLGAFAQAEGESFDHFDEDYDATVVIPILFGLQHDFLSINNSSALRPYISFGGGPYWITNVKERDRFDNEEVISTIKPGIFFGGGLNFFLFKSFAINFDLKYHVVDLQLDNNN